MLSSLPPASPSCRLTRRQLLQASAIALAGLPLSGCGWTLAEVRPAVGKPGNKDELFVYTWSQYTDDTLLEEFTSQNGIRVIADIFNSNETMLATFQAGKGSIYSVVYPSDYKVSEMIEKGLLSPLNPNQVEGLDNLLPQFQNSPHDPGNKYSVPLSWGTTGFIYNSEKLNPPPDDWDYLWQNQAKLSRRITLLDDVREVMGAVLRSLGYSYNSTKPNEIKQAYEKLTKLKPAIASFTTDAWRDQMVAGDLLIAMGYSADAMGVINENPQLKYVIPKSGSSLWSDTMAIPKTAPNFDAAYAWVNFMLQPSVAAQITQRLFFATPNQAAYDQLPAPLRNNETLFPADATLSNCERIKPLDANVTELYDRYWTKLTSG
jgi:spermidine/putrescine transport system substrate-binding protein